MGGICNDGLYCARRLGNIFGEARQGICEDGKFNIKGIRRGSRDGCMLFNGDI